MGARHDPRRPRPLTLDAETALASVPPGHKDELRLWLRLLTLATLMESEIRTRLRRDFDTTLPAST